MHASRWALSIGMVYMLWFIIIHQKAMYLMAELRPKGIIHTKAEVLRL